MFGKIKKSILNVNLKKYARQIQHPLTDLKIELLVKIINDFKLSTIFAKSSISDMSQNLSLPLTTISQTFFTNNKRALSRFFGTVIPTTQPGFYLFKVNNKNTKNTRARCEMCLKLTVRASELRQWHYLVSLLLTFNTFHTFIWCFHRWLWASKSWLSRWIVERNVTWTTALTHAHLRTSISPPELVTFHWPAISN